MTRRNKFGLMVLLSAGICCFGQSPPRPLSLADCLRLASSVPSAVTLARQETQIAAAGLVVARSGFLPHASFNNSVIYNTPRAGGQAFISFNGSREYISQAGVAVELDTSGRLRAAYARAKVDRDIAQTGAQLSERDLRRAVTVSYFRVLAARRAADAARRSLDEAHSFEVRAKALLSGGEVAQADVVKASAQVAIFDQLKRAADLDAQLANQELASYWTVDVDVPLNLEDTLIQSTNNAPDAEMARSFLGRAEFRLFDLQKRGFTLDARREKAALLPQVFLGMQYGIDASRYSWQQRGTAFVASVNVPIFDWFRARNLSRQFTLRSQQVETTRQVTERVYSREYLAAQARSTSIHEQAKVAETQVKLLEDNLKLSQVRYEGGEGPALDVVVAQTQLQQARANYFNTLFQYAAARADLEVAAGR